METSQALCGLVPGVLPAWVNSQGQGLYSPCHLADSGRRWGRVCPWGRSDPLPGASRSPRLKPFRLQVWWI